MHRNFGPSYLDMRRMEALLAESELDWTIYRAPRLPDKPAKGHYRLTVNTLLPAGFNAQISRVGAAAAMLDGLTQPDHFRSYVEIAQ
ncbi:MAG: NAD(P)H-binding protein [Cryobacterium sp.]|nr:NAD(P)H-binding protein [Cryobacterium sp.]